MTGKTIKEIVQEIVEDVLTIFFGLDSISTLEKNIAGIDMSP